MKSILISSIVAALMLFIQSTWLSRGIIMGIIPNLALDVLLFTSFINKEGQGIITSFLVGIVADILSASPLGYYAFIYTSCGYFATPASLRSRLSHIMLVIMGDVGAPCGNT